MKTYIVDSAAGISPAAALLSVGGIVALPGTPAQFATFLQSETAKYARIISEAGIVADA